MAVVHFTRALDRFHQAPTCEVDATTVGEALAGVFALRPALKSYVLDDQGALRKHVAVYVNGRAIGDRKRLSDEVGSNDEVYVFQALTGG
jgi:sulfur carrier protein ThiS